MSRILLQTTIAENHNDWAVQRFSLLAEELRSCGHEVVARNRVEGRALYATLSVPLGATAVGTGIGASDSQPITGHWGPRQ